ATGQVLYAFKQAGVSITSSSFIKGVRYLLATQRADGSWPRVNSDGLGSTFAPTMWAVIGLAGSFGAVTTGGLQVMPASASRAKAARNLEVILDAFGSRKLALGTGTR